MALYEHVLLARQDVSAQQVEALVEQFKGIIEANGGSISKVEYWGVKSLGYRMKKNRKAHYSLLNINGSCGHRGRDRAPDAHQRGRACASSPFASTNSRKVSRS
jgi:ribosomal protein S6